MINKASSHRVLPLLIGLIVVFILVLRVIDIPLMGPHKTRQADTLFTGYSYCIGDSTFLYPKVAHRENTEGVAIGEFPLFSAIVSWPCRLTGEWSEVSAKMITYFFWLLNLLVWSQWYRRRSSSKRNQSGGAIIFRYLNRQHHEDTEPDNLNLVEEDRNSKIPLNHDHSSSKESLLSFLLFFTFTPLLLTYLLIPIPDTLGLILTGCAALLWQNKSKTSWILGSLFFALAFLVRPYLFPLLIMIAPSLPIGFFSFGLCCLGYLFWFKYWIQHTQIWYYLTETKAITSLFTSGWKVPRSLLDQISLQHLNYIGLIPFYKALERNRRLLVAWVFAIAFILLLKGDHFVNHAYYFIAAGFISVIAMLDGFLSFKRKGKIIFSYLFVALGIFAVQHHWHKPDNKRYLEIPQLIEKQNIPFTERIAVFDTFSPQTFYFAKRVGWYFEKDQWQGPNSCPKEAHWALLFDPKDDHPYLVACEQ